MWKGRVNEDRIKIVHQSPMECSYQRNSIQVFGDDVQASLHFGTTSSPAKIIILKENVFPSLDLKTIGIFFVKNPPVNKAARITKYLQDQAQSILLQQVSYNNYFTYITKDPSPGLPFSLSLQNYSPNQFMKLRMIKKYPWNVKSDSTIFVNLHGLAETVDFDAIPAITCSGYIAFGENILR